MLRNRVKNTIVFLLYAFFMFSFLHSEFGLLDYDGKDHGAHDYCEIIKNSDTPTKSVHDRLPILSFCNKVICSHCVSIFEAQLTKIPFNKIVQCSLSKTNIEVYLFNKTILV